MDMHERSVSEPAKIIRDKRKTSFVTDVMQLVSGTTFAQLLGILISPILTRLYTPEAFGVVAIFSSIASILGVVACLRYELSIMLPESDVEAASLLILSLIFAGMISLLTVPLVWWGRDILVLFLNAPGLKPYLWLIPPAVLLQGIFLALRYWSSRTGHFGRLSFAMINQSAIASLAKLGFGSMGFATGGVMIGANVGAQALAISMLGGQVWKSDRRLLLQSISWRQIICVLGRYRKFPLYDSWSALLNSISLQLPTLLLSTFFSPLVVGLYALGYRILSTPTGLVGSAIAQVFYQRASNSMADQTIATTVKSVFQTLIMLGAFPFMLLVVIGPDFFVTVFGEQWTEAGIYMQILAPWLFFVFVGSPMSTLSNVLEVQEVGLFFNLALVTSRVVSLVIGGIMGNVLLALGLFSISGTILWIWLCLYLFDKVGLDAFNMTKDATRHFLIAGMFIVPVLLAKYFLHSIPIVALIIIGVVLTVAYYSYLLSHNRTLRGTAQYYLSKFRRVG